ncbi:MAG: hypothetical protein ABL963_15765 [Longimicrobiales bacterium]
MAAKKQPARPKTSKKPGKELSEAQLRKVSGGAEPPSGPLRAEPITGSPTRTRATPISD